MKQNLRIKAVVDSLSKGLQVVETQSQKSRKDILEDNLEKGMSQNEDNLKCDDCFNLYNSGW